MMHVWIGRDNLPEEKMQLHSGRSSSKIEKENVYHPGF
jgi:hypothetical protein